MLGLGVFLEVVVVFSSEAKKLNMHVLTMMLKFKYALKSSPAPGQLLSIF